MVVGRGDGHRLAHAEIGQHPRVGRLEPRRHPERADPHDQPLAGHEPGHRLHGAEGAGIGQGHRRTGEVVRGDPVGVDLADQLLVGRHESAEVPEIGVDDARHEEGAATAGLLDVDCQPEAHVLVPDHPGGPLAVGIGHEGCVHRRYRAESLDHGVPDQMGEADLAARRPREMVVDDGSVDLEQLGRHDPHARGRRHPERGLHVGHDAPGRPAQRGRPGDGCVGVAHRRRGHSDRCGCAVGRPGRGAVRRRSGAPGRTVVDQEFAPGRGHRRRVVPEPLVHVLDEPGVGTERAGPGDAPVLRLSRCVSVSRARHRPQPTGRPRSGSRVGNPPR